MRTVFRKIRIWLAAWFQDYPFFRVYYPNGEKTYCLYQREATGLRDTFKGEMVVDYDYGIEWIYRTKQKEEQQ